MGRLKTCPVYHATVSAAPMRDAAFEKELTDAVKEGTVEGTGVEAEASYMWDDVEFRYHVFRRKDLRDQPVKIAKFGVDSDSDRCASAPASPTSNLDPSSLMDAPTPGNGSAPPELPDVYIPDPATDPESRLTAVEGSLANIEALLLRVLHNSQNPPATAPVPAVPAPAVGPDFTTLTPAAKSVL
ncbi:hypothetical protein K438DRAFT_1990506 [Mycena galopus ATCC 62051]|nr:hypothetical protein K438DRAFT_1990506 [Mycena galopus ATCC 62051]